jgi:hypothetical protein
MSLKTVEASGCNSVTTGDSFGGDRTVRSTGRPSPPLPWVCRLGEQKTDYVLRSPSGPTELIRLGGSSHP